MFRRFLIASAIAVAISISVQRSVFAEGIWVEGGLDCGTWIEARTAQRARFLEEYLLGLIDGMVLGTGIDFWKAHEPKLRREQLYVWMDSYCRETPLSTVHPGAMKLINERTGNAWDRHWGGS